MHENNSILQVIVTLPWVIFLSIMGGLVGFIRRLNQSTIPQSLLRIFLRVFGDTLNVLFDKALQGTSMWAEVVITDTGVTVDLPSGTLAVKFV